MFTSNFAGNHGAGLFSEGGSPVIRDCEFVGNDGGSGGGLWLEGKSAPVLSRCEIYWNTAGGMGGGLAINMDAHPTVKDCDIHDNTASTGGGMSIAAARGTIVDCSVTSNNATFGGGIAVLSGNMVDLLRTDIEWNESVASGGGIYVSDSSYDVASCSVSHNDCEGEGGALWSLNSNGDIAGTRFLDNSAPSSGGIYLLTSALAVAGGEVAGNVAGITVEDPDRSSADARYNWWGDSSGPFHATANPSGLGDTVTDGVVFAPWNTATGISDDPALLSLSWTRIKAMHR